jgi:hypothetical protein
MNIDAFAHASRIDHQMRISAQAINVIPSAPSWSDRLRAHLNRNRSRDMMKLSLDFQDQS